MTTDRIKEILSASRPQGQDDTDPQFHAAIELARKDSALQLWMHEERARDLRHAALMRSSDIPSQLESSILDAMLGKPVESPPPVVFAPRFWMSLAASLSLFLASVGTLQSLLVKQHHGSQDMVALIGMHREAGSGVALFTPEFAEIRRFLSLHQSPLPEALPGLLHALEPAGCESFEWKGERVSVIQWDDRVLAFETRLYIVKSGEEATPEAIDRQSASLLNSRNQMLQWKKNGFHYALISHSIDARLMMALNNAL